MQRTQIWKIIAIIETILILGLVLYIAFDKQQSYNGDAFASEDAVVHGQCRFSLPSDTNFIRVQVSLKGKMLAISEFEWNDTNYVSGPGCFRVGADQSEFTMNNYIYRAAVDTLTLFHIVIRSRANNNDYEFLIKVFNLKNELIGKYPEASESMKGKIPFIGVPTVLAEKIKLKS